MSKSGENARIINGINLTQREVDVISCIINVRGTKKIATILSISLRTAERHIQNIMLKMRCNSQEGIKDFIESSESLPFIKRHYFYLLVKNKFEQQLKKISLLVRKKNTICFIKDEQNSANKDLLVKYLELSGIKVVLKQEEFANSESPILNILSKESVHEIEAKDLTQSNNIYILFDNEINHVESRELDNIYIIPCNNNEYYYTFLKILALLLPDININEFVLELKKISDNTTALISDTTEKVDSVAQFSNISPTPPADSILSKLNRKITRRILFICFSCILIFIIGFKFGLLKNFTILPTTLKTKQISSNFSVPNDQILLKRLKIIDQITKFFKTGSDNINTVIILGPGGSGKSTLARQFALKQNNSVIWEINAQDKHHLNSSFKQLAYFLCSTTADKQELKEIQHIEDAESRNKQILFFVQESLKERPNWLLIFDNVENFKYIQQYFPYSVKAWGKGKIIITTRDSNIINNHHITNNNVVQMTELSEEEKLELFTSIIDNSSLNHELEKNRVALLNFLENIPSFPLDIITAAHYIKETGVTYDKYIELVNNLDQNLAITQEHMLKEIGQYSETRYGIINLSLKHIMDKNPAFQDLLLFISLIDPHNIPVDLLNTYKDFSTVNDFLIELKRLSFITNNKVTDHNKIFIAHNQ